MKPPAQHQLVWVATISAHGILFAFLRVTMAVPSTAPEPPRTPPAFLGALLDSSQKNPSTPPSTENASDPQLSFRISGHLTVSLPPLEPVLAFQNISATGETQLMRDSLPPKLFNSEKQHPHAMTTVIAPPSTSAPAWIRGPARRRELVYRPPMATFLNQVRLTRLRSKDIARTVDIELKFTLLMNGQVDQVEIIRSSGDPLLDLMGLRYLKEWKFSMVDPKDVRIHSDSWGRVVLRLDLESSREMPL